jgi:hypothetical protein
LATAADGFGCGVENLKELRLRLSEALAPFTRIMSAVELLLFYLRDDRPQMVAVPGLTPVTLVLPLQLTLGQKRRGGGNGFVLVWRGGAAKVCGSCGRGHRLSTLGIGS